MDKEIKKKVCAAAKRGRKKNPKIKELQDNVEKVKREGSPELKKQEIEQMKIVLGEAYEEIVNILKNYIDIKKEYYPLLSLWIIGTYFHKSFNTYPYLFVNAMKGSGKTRLLNLIKYLSWNGELLTSIREASLFRSAGNNTICIDEFEGIMKKENAGLREILNASYKKGIMIKRMKKKKTNKGSEWIVEEFEPYTPIVMANIWGVEEVLADRCITIILEKSQKSYLTKKVEDFENNNYINYTKNNLDLIRKRCSLWCLCSLCRKKEYRDIYQEWNNYINILYINTTLTALTTLTTSITQDILGFQKLKKANYTQTTPNLKLESFFNKIIETKINGRNLELFMPLFIISRTIDENLFNKVLGISKEINKEKRAEELTESRDVMLINFISVYYDINVNFVDMNDLLNRFRNYVHDDERDYQWLNSQWLGRALKRLNLIVEKRRVSDGMQIILNVKKAKEKAEIFK